MISHDSGIFHSGYALGKNLLSAGIFTLGAIFQLIITHLLW
jgi:hypothetical protein